MTAEEFNDAYALCQFHIGDATFVLQFREQTAARLQKSEERFGERVEAGSQLVAEAGLDAAGIATIIHGTTVGTKARPVNRPEADGLDWAALARRADLPLPTAHRLVGELVRQLQAGGARLYLPRGDWDYAIEAGLRIAPATYEAALARQLGLQLHAAHALQQATDFHLRAPAA